MGGGSGDVPDYLEETADDERDAEVGAAFEEEVGVGGCEGGEEDSEDYGGGDGGGVMPHFEAGPDVIVLGCIAGVEEV